jgi:hypothetical protein
MPLYAASPFYRKQFCMNGSNMTQLLSAIGSSLFFPNIATTASSITPRLDLSIEGMRSQQWGVGVFIFMLIGVLVFSGIIYAVAFGKFAPKTMKPGEKVMFGAVILGTVVAVIFGGLQLLSGYLF